jgi:DhnA family fructose-bisphosphate aldolase class Ia
VTPLVSADRYRALIEARVHDPSSLRSALIGRRRRPVAGADGRLLLLAADHTARGMLAAGGDPLAVADRRTLLDRLVRSLAQPGVDGVLASADVLEELAWLGALDERLAIGTMNRGGVIGASWELDDRMTAYDVEHIEAFGLDGGKTLLRIDHDDAGVARTIESVAAVTTQLGDRGLMSMIEPLPYRKDANGRAVLDPSDDALIKVVAIASGLGSSSAYTWLKIPGSDRMPEVAGATSLPILMLGGDPGADADRTFARWEAAMREPNVRGLVAGRALLYPHSSEPEDAVRRAASIVHPTVPHGGAQ